MISLATPYDEKIDTIYSSDLRRTLDTATTIGSVHNAPVILCPELREVNFGRCEGLTYQEIVKRYPQLAKMWRESDPYLAFPGGESLSSLSVRIRGFIQRLEKHQSSDVVLVVTHGGPLRILVCLLTELEMSTLWRMEVDPASLTILEGRQKQMDIRVLNDRTHLC